MTKQRKISNYKEIGGMTGHLARLEPFTGNSMSGHWVAPKNPTTHQAYYSVVSYSTEIARVTMFPLDVWVTDTHYSVTTTRQQNLCRKFLGMRDYMNKDNIERYIAECDSQYA
jgi:hypothetical protein